MGGRGFRYVALQPFTSFSFLLHRLLSLGTRVTRERNLSLTKGLLFWVRVCFAEGRVDGRRPPKHDRLRRWFVRRRRRRRTPDEHINTSGRRPVCTLGGSNTCNCCTLSSTRTTSRWSSTPATSSPTPLVRRSSSCRQCCPLGSSSGRPHTTSGQIRPLPRPRSSSFFFRPLSSSSGYIDDRPPYRPSIGIPIRRTSLHQPPSCFPLSPSSQPSHSIGSTSQGFGGVYPGDGEGGG